MRYRSYTKAVGGMSLFPSIVKVIQRGNLRVYSREVYRGCRQCRRLRADERCTGPLVCACGNPYINASSLPQDRVKVLYPDGSHEIYPTATMARIAADRVAGARVVVPRRAISLRRGLYL